MVKASDLFVACLEEEGVEYVFGVPGEENLDFLDSLSRSKKIRLILTRHGIYWHPYGSVITSEEARTNMIRYLSLGDEKGGEDMVWLLLRLGWSKEQPLSHRLPLLVGLYGMIALTGWPILLVTLLGLVDQWVHFRRRSAGVR